MAQVADLENKYAFEVYPKRGLTIVKGLGSKLWDENGNEYIDCIMGNGVGNVGHCNPKVAEALSNQANKLITCGGLFYNDKRSELFEKLIAVAPKGLDRAYLCNSGAESIEAALKFAKINTGKHKFVCAVKAFHGRTMGALSATYKAEYREGFEPFLDSFTFVPYNDIEAIKSACNDETAAVMLELVQGEGGVNPAKKEYISEVRRFTEEKGILFIVDEVQTGFGRTGKMFACEHYGVTPDIMACAKGIAGGVPMGATLVNRKLEIKPGKHGSTFGGNPLAAAAACAVLDLMKDEQLPEKSAELGTYFREKFMAAKPPIVKEFRNLGLMIGIELETESKPFIMKLQEVGVLAIPAGPMVIRLLPALTITKEEIDTVIEKLFTVLN